MHTISPIRVIRYVGRDLAEIVGGVKYINLLLVALVVVGIGLFLRPVLYACIYALFIAYLLNPIVTKLALIGMSRAVASFVIICASAGVIGTLIVMLMPVLYSQALGVIKLLIDRVPFLNLEDIKDILSSSGLPSYQEIKSATENPLNLLTSDLFRGDGAEFLKLFKDAPSYFVKAVSGIAHSSLGIGSSIVTILTSLLLSFYILANWPSITKIALELIPRSYVRDFALCFQKIDEVISSYLRGQTLVCLVLACYYSFCFVVIRLEYSLVMGFVSGLLTFLPYIGPSLCCILSVCIAISQGFGITKVVLVALMFLVGQMIESYVVTPGIVGKRLALNQAWLVMGVVVFSSHAGFWGALLSVPFTAILSVLIQFAVKKYKTSNFYLSE
ncbi:pheromone autoinducer 2 transporter [Anaplasma phagocytophilum]|uniref:AI-2E family transporter n=1 Tax=Anaplasma phagocytophilum TaxID=948 RepID=UPI0007E20613|nr:AI-2E family transporter [Anaplasma phagocytophilum]SCV65722.1 pheromone autoinducer 2 transporter [Anaplasma phagocytophilum]